METQLAGVTMDSQFEAIGDVVRRRILLRLLESTNERPVDIDQITTPGSDGELSLYHVHLPLLKEKGYIEMDAEQKFVYKGSSFSEIEPLLDVLAGNQTKLPDGLR